MVRRLLAFVLAALIPGAPVVTAACQASCAFKAAARTIPNLGVGRIPVASLGSNLVGGVGAVLQAYLFRTEADCRDLASAGSRVRLCKGAYKEPESVAYQSKIDVDTSYVRCMRVLLAGEGYPMFATHDPRIISIGRSLTESAGRSKDSFEFQMLYGIRPDEQLKLAAEGYTTRVYVPFGEDWYGYFMRRLAERPANLAFFARSLVSRD